MGLNDRWKEGMKVQEQVLSMLPLKEYIKQYDEVSKMMSQIEEDYSEGTINLTLYDLTQLRELVNSDLMQGEIFNWIGVDEFVAYLRQHFHCTIFEEEVINYWIKDYGIDIDS